MTISSFHALVRAPYCHCHCHKTGINLRGERTVSIIRYEHVVHVPHVRTTVYLVLASSNYYKVLLRNVVLSSNADRAVVTVHAA